MDKDPVSSRRNFLLGSAALGASAWVDCGLASSSSGGAQDTGVSFPNSSDRSGLSISVHAPDGRHYAGSVQVIISSKVKRETLKKRQGQQVFVRYLPPGVYGVRVIPKDCDFQSFYHEFRVVDRLLMIPVYLGKKGWPSFRMGPSIVPFEPVDDKLGIAFVSPFWQDTTQILKYLPALRQIGLVPYYPQPRAKASFLRASGSVVFLRAEDPRHKIFSTKLDEQPSKSGEAMFQAIRDVFPPSRFGEIRLGVPLSTEETRVKLLDNQFLVKFHPRATKKKLGQLISTKRAIVSPVPHLPDLWLVKFIQESNYIANLRAIDRLVDEGQVLFGEPSLLFELTPHGCTGHPNDPWLPCQNYIQVQGIDSVWQLEGGPGCGSSAITVATIDQGVNLDPLGSLDLDRNAVQCVDLQYLSQGLTPPPNRPPDCSAAPLVSHGMAVYGVIGAPHNSLGIAGIAPGVKSVAIGYNPLQSPQSYASMLLWVAGVGDTLPVDNANQVIGAVSSMPPLTPASIINCSHGIEFMPDPTPIMDALQRLATEGRQGLGTAVVYSAGEANGSNGMGTELQGIQAAAMSPHTIIVGNTAVVDSAVSGPHKAGDELHDPSSNFGSRLDLCALAGLQPQNNTFDGVSYRGSYSLYLDNSQATPEMCASEPATGVIPFGYTSAAAAMVSGVAALLLSANANLTSSDLRSVLLATATKVDPSCGDPTGAWTPQAGPGSAPPPSPGLDSHSAWYGFGRLDALGAVNKVLLSLSGKIPQQ